jgi:hypothetical protein
MAQSAMIIFPSMGPEWWQNQLILAGVSTGIAATPDRNGRKFAAIPKVHREAFEPDTN